MPRTGRGGLLVAAAIVAAALAPMPAGAADAPACAAAKAALEKAQGKLADAKDAVAVAKKRLRKARAGGRPHAIRLAKRKLAKARRRLDAAKTAVGDARAARDAACAPQTAPGLYVSLGDSVGAGFGATAGHGFVSLLYSHYQSSLGVNQLSNRAVPGETSGSLRGAQLQGALADINDPSTDTRVVTIDIGGNDSLQNLCADWSAPSCPLRSNLAATLGDLQSALAADPGAEPLVAMVYYNPGNGTANEGSDDTRLLGANRSFACADTGTDLGLNEVIAQEAAAHGALVANPYPAFKTAGQSYMSGDGIHPNDAGHAAIAAAFETAAALC